MTARAILVTGASLCMLTVILGAFGAHALKAMISVRMLEVYETGILYQMFHAIGILVVGIVLAFGNNLNGHLGYSPKLLKLSYLFFLLGIILFCGSLYALAFTEAILGNRIAQLGIITPFGGLSFIAGWLFLILAFWKPTSPSN